MYNVYIETYKENLNNSQLVKLLKQTKHVLNQLYNANYKGKIILDCRGLFLDIDNIVFKEFLSIINILIVSIQERKVNNVDIICDKIENSNWLKIVKDLISFSAVMNKFSFKEENDSIVNESYNLDWRYQYIKTCFKD